MSAEDDDSQGVCWIVSRVLGRCWRRGGTSADSGEDSFFAADIEAGAGDDSIVVDLKAHSHVGIGHLKDCG